MKLNEILRLPEKIPCDKRIHALIGVVIASVLLTIGVFFWATFMIVVIIAWGVEFYQKYTKSGQYDNYDALAVVVGGLIVMLPMVVSNFNK